MKGLEELSNLHLDINSDFFDEDCERIKIIEKELKAFELIRPLLAVDIKDNEYLLWVKDRKLIISKEQYDLLKEVLKNE